LAPWSSPSTTRQRSAQAAVHRPPPADPSIRGFEFRRRAEGSLLGGHDCKSQLPDSLQSATEKPFLHVWLDLAALGALLSTDSEREQTTWSCRSLCAPLPGERIPSGHANSLPTAACPEGIAGGLLAARTQTQAGVNFF